MVRDEHAPSPRPLSPAPLSDMSQVASSLSAHSWKDAFAEAAEASIGVVTGSRSISLSQPRLFSGALPIPDELTELDFSEEDMTLCNGMVKEAPRLVRMAVPLAATNVISYAIGLVTVGFAGRLGEQELAIAVLATSLFNVTGLSILSGFNAALETFCGQFYGAGNYRQVGIALQRALLLATVLSAILAGLWSKAAVVLNFLGQDAALSAGAARYVMLLSPALWLAAVFEATKRFLAAQGETTPGTWATSAALLVAPVYNYFLIYYLNLGLDGCALAVNAVEFTMVGVLLTHATLLERRRKATNSPLRTWFGWSAEALQGWGAYLKVALPSCLMICVEWWTFELLILMSGWLPHARITVATMGVCINLSGSIFWLVSGVSLAASSRIAVVLGAGQAHAARHATFASLFIGLVVEVAAAVTCLLLRHKLSHIFTSSEAVSLAVSSVMPLFAISIIGDGASSILQSLLRGAGKQMLGAYANLLGYWGIGLPLAYYLAFVKGMGLLGLWAGIAVTNTLQGFLMLAIALWFDYDKAAKKAQKRGGALQEALLDGLVDEEALLLTVPEYERGMGEA